MVNTGFDLLVKHRSYSARNFSVGLGKARLGIKLARLRNHHFGNFPEVYQYKITSVLAEERILSTW